MNLAGTAAIANAGAGVEIDGFVPVIDPIVIVDDPTLPTAATTLIQDDVISGNTGDGVQINSVPQVVVENSQIGTNAAGTAAIANGGAGIDPGSDLLGLSSLNEPDTIKADVISGNAGAGILADAALGTQIAGNIIDGNFIGTDAEGQGSDMPDQGNGLSIVSSGGQVSSHDSINFNTILGNGGNGVEVEGVAENVDFNTNRIGGELLSAGPSLGLVAGNGKDGVLLDDVTAPAGSTAPSVVLTGNDVDDNDLDGLQVIGGGSTIVTADTFLANVGDGVEFDSGATNDTLIDDFVLMNRAFGVLLSQSSDITLTGLTIENNGATGVDISDSTGIVIKGETESGNGQRDPIATPF